MDKHSEISHGKIKAKLATAKLAAGQLYCILDVLRPELQSLIGKKKDLGAKLFSAADEERYLDQVRAIKDQYFMCVAGTPSPQFEGAPPSASYSRAIAGQDFGGKLNRLLSCLLSIAEKLSFLFPPTATLGLDGIKSDIRSAIGATLRPFAKEISDSCECGATLQIHCKSPNVFCTVCGKIYDDGSPKVETIRDSPRNKISSYDVSRHYKYWMDRIQGASPCSIQPEELEKIKTGIASAGLRKTELNCENIRAVLKDPAVSLTCYNDYAPWLVKICGGNGPPQLGFADNAECAARFSKIMRLYDVVAPGTGNKRYYPYFIYKICESMFRGDPAKIKILNFMHLQARDTVIKNDKLYERICAASAPEDGLVYCPTDPSKQY